MDEPARDALTARFAGGRLALVLYGAIVAGTALAIAGAHAGSATGVVVAMLGALLIYWVSHVYVQAVAEHVADPSVATLVVVRTALRHEAALPIGGLPTVGAFLAAILLGSETSTATSVGLWFTVGMLGATGFAAGRKAGARGWRLALESLVAAGFGLVAVGLKIAIH